MKFFPLTLGAPKRKTREERESERPPRTYDEWRELMGRPEEFEPCPAEDSLSRLMSHDPALPRPWLILGEPGSGKTSLLEHWHATWLQAIPRPYLGMKIPVLVRLRDVPHDLWKGGPGTFADALWDRGLAVGRSKARGTAAEAVLGLHRQVFTPVWLLDGLDELASPIADRGLWDSLRDLPGDVALTCRTAVFQAARAEIGDLIGSEWRILGLEPVFEQEEFLAQAYADEKIDPASAADMVRDLNANASLRSLATSPLILRLVAEAGPRFKLRATRAGFYEAATNALWERRLRDRPELLDLAPERDATLAAIATTLGLATEAPKRVLYQTGARPELRDALRRSGLLTFDDRRDRISFPHLTFQEYHLAGAFSLRQLRGVLNDHWSDARYEETLALLIALHARGEGARKVEAELRDFVASARVDHASNSSRLRLLGRSPLRTILHVLSRAAVSPSLALPVEFKDQPTLLRFAIGCDPLTPVAALAELAHDPDEKVRQQVLQNGATPGVVLAELARDPDDNVRQQVSWNIAAPEATLAELARDPDDGVRRGVAGNPAAPGAALAELARDRALRGRVAGNPAAPVATLAELARDPDWAVRKELAGNPAVSAATMAEMARDPDRAVRKELAANTSTPAVTMAKLARDPDRAVRWEVARNTVTPEATMASLARDLDEAVRAGVAGNPATPEAMLAGLAHDSGKYVRWGVACNPATPAAALAELARDPDDDVREGVAGNPETPAAALAELARDPDERMRATVAGNPVTPAEALTGLAHDPDDDVRYEVARNPATPAIALAELARDRNKDVRGEVAGNPATPTAALAELARDRNKDVRVEVAANDGTPAAALAELARDRSKDVRREVAANAATPEAALADLARDQDKGVRGGVAGNPATPAATMAELARDPNDNVRKEVARNHQVLLEDLCGAADDRRRRPRRM